MALDLTNMMNLMPVLTGLKSASFFGAAGFLFIQNYRCNPHLYQYKDKKQLHENWVNYLLPLARKLNYPAYVHYIEARLEPAAIRKDWTANHFIANQFFYGMLGLSFSLVFLNLILKLSVVASLGLAIFAFLVPLLRIDESVKSRRRSCNRDLPFYIDYLALSISAGLDFNRALQTVVSNAPKSPLRDEFENICSNLHLGMSREESLLEFERHIGTVQVRTFVQTLLQALSLGTNMSETLQAMSLGFNTKRFQLAEEEAGKASVKMMLPLVAFVLPAMFIILLGPMLLSLIEVSK